MFVLRFFAGPIVDSEFRRSGLLAGCSASRGVGVVLAGHARAVNATGAPFAAATLYGVGKTFFWPTTLGRRVGAVSPGWWRLLLNAIAGVGMIAVGTIGGPAIGTHARLDLNGPWKKPHAPGS